MGKKPGKKVLDGVKRTFRRIPFVPSSEKDRFGSSQLARINRAPLMARRDAAYDRAVALLRVPLFSYPEEVRSELYEAVLKLLYIAGNTGRALNESYESDGDKIPDPVNQYLILLIDTVRAAMTLVDHELIMFKEEKELSSFIGSDITTQIRSADEVFSNSELNIYQCITELIELADKSIVRNREIGKRDFAKEDIERYNKALKEYTDLYSGIKIDGVDKPETESKS